MLLRGLRWASDFSPVHLCCSYFGTCTISRKYADAKWVKMRFKKVVGNFNFTTIIIGR